MSLLCLLAILVILQADTIKVLLAVSLKQRFLQVQPPTLHPSVGKEVQAGDGLFNKPSKSHQTLVPLFLLPWECLIWQIKWASAALAGASFAGWTPLKYNNEEVLPCQLQILIKTKVACLHCIFDSTSLRKPEYTLSSLSVLTTGEFRKNSLPGFVS